MNSPSLTTLKKLFALSGNKCAYPNCKAPLIELSGTITGEVAHINGANINGPRYDPSQLESERHGFDNLILLCSRHHTIIDTEISKHTPELLRKFKNDNESLLTIEVSLKTDYVISKLLEKYNSVVVHNNTGQVSINSPGSLQANTINFKHTKPKIFINAPVGSIGTTIEEQSYIKYLIDKYQEYQKQDIEKIGNSKYKVIHKAIEKEFGSKYTLVPITRFQDLTNYLFGRIDKTKIGRIRKNRLQKNYHNFSDHVQKINNI